MLAVFSGPPQLRPAPSGSSKLQSCDPVVCVKSLCVESIMVRLVAILAVLAAALRVEKECAEEERVSAAHALARPP